jgi:integrase
MRRPLDWPRYMKARRLADGSVGYYWVPHERDVANGFTLKGEALGKSYGDAIERARALNAHLDAWRGGRGGENNLDHGPRFGTLAWLFERYRRSAAFERVSERSRSEYLRALQRLEDLPTKDGRHVGDLPVSAISARSADKMYAAVQVGPRGKRVRQANLSIDIARRAWDVVRRLYPQEVAQENPFRGVLRIHLRLTKPAASRMEAYALAQALKALGEPHLGAAALICFEWLQRPENILAGSITWDDYRNSQHPKHVRIFHHKTGQEVYQPLEEDGRLLYPEIEAYLGSLEPLARAIVVTNGTRGQPRPYSVFYARRRVREARKLAGLGEHVTLDACRHGGMTELGDAELAEQGVMALSGHKTPHAARLYVKRTERQRVRAAAKRRAWVEAGEGEAKVEMTSGRQSGNDGVQAAQPIDDIGTASWARTTDPQIHNLVL